MKPSKILEENASQIISKENIIEMLSLNKKANKILIYR